MNIMKKTLSVVLALCLCIAPLVLATSAADRTKKALPLSAGLEALRGQFESGVTDECDGYALDYTYYSPAGKNDNEKYPIVIYLHGIGHGSYVGSQLDDCTMVTWASAELQERWTDTGGAYILFPRCPEDKLQYWNASFINPLRTLIDCFIEEHGDNVDTTRIFIGGSSAGGEMTWDMAIAYPEYFAGIYPLAATGTRTAEDIKTCKDVSVWVFASKLDPIVNYTTNVLPQWEKICQYNANPLNCRLSSFGEVLNPDGTKGDSNHRLYTTIMYDLFTEDGSVYPNLTTENGNGKIVSIRDGKGMISWMCNTHSEFEGGQTSDDVSVGIFDAILIPIRNIILKIANLIQRILGFV
jgi:predicted peptidase